MANVHAVLRLLASISFFAVTSRSVVWDTCGSPRAAGRDWAWAYSYRPCWAWGCSLAVEAAAVFVAVLDGARSAARVQPDDSGGFGPFAGLSSSGAAGGIGASQPTRRNMPPAAITAMMFASCPSEPKSNSTSLTAEATSSTAPLTHSARDFTLRDQI